MIYGDIERWALALDTGVLVLERDSSDVEHETEYYVHLHVCVCVCVRECLSVSLVAVPNRCCCRCL